MYVTLQNAYTECKCLYIFIIHVLICCFVCHETCVLGQGHG